MTGFDSEGFYPQHNCRSCAKPLNADGGHPAELYAGTYTGLCYACERIPRYTVTSYSDGAITWSYPPHAPSWRRDRETFTSYSDCPECHGQGFQMKYSASSWSTYSDPCQTCRDRFWTYPPRKARNDRVFGRDKAIRVIAEALYQKECAKIKHKAKRAGQTLTAEDFAPVRTRWYAKFIRVRDHWQRIVAARYPEV